MLQTLVLKKSCVPVRNAGQIQLSDIRTYSQLANSLSSNQVASSTQLKAECVFVYIQSSCLLAGQ